MTKFEVGKPFPLSNYANGQEKCVATFNDAFFDVCFYTHSEELDTKMVKNEPLRYGVYSSANIPFFLVYFPKSEMVVEASLNIHAVQEDKVEAWLNSDSNKLFFYLIDADTNELKAMRMIGLKHEVAEQIRDILENQDELYKDADAVEYAIGKITENFALQDMLERTEMHNSIKL